MSGGGDGGGETADTTGGKELGGAGPATLGRVGLVDITGVKMIQG